MIRSVTARGFVADAGPGAAAGDVVAVDLGAGGCVVATVIAVEEGSIRCAFLSPLDARELAGARAQGRIVVAASAPAEAAGEGKAVAARWPLPLRAAIAIGGALALWGMIARAIG